MAGCALAATIGLWPLASLAQAPPVPTEQSTYGSELLQPSLQGNPATPPRFRKRGPVTAAVDGTPPTNKFAAPPRVGGTPVYGSPNGFGAGDTGYDSLNTPRAKKKKPVTTAVPGGLVPQQPETTFVPVPTYNAAAPSRPPVEAKPPPPDIYPRKAAARTGATLPPVPDETPLSNPPVEVHTLSASTRPGAVLPIPPAEYFNYTAPLYSSSTQPPTLPPPNTFPLGTLPYRPLPIAGDPYAALGIRAGSFLLLPSIDFASAVSTNAEHVPGGGAAAYFVAAPELQVRSDWDRHSLTADIVGSYTEYAETLVPSLNTPFLNAKVDGRIDVLRGTQIDVEQRVLVNTDNPGSPNLQAQVARLPINTDVGETLGITQQFNRLSVSLKGMFDRATYDPSPLTDGTSSSNGDRNFDQYAGVARVTYEYDPGWKPFVEVQEDSRIHDLPFDRSGLQRDSVGTTAKIGSVVDMFGSLSGEMAVGYTDRNYKDPTLPNVSGVVAAGALLWQPTALTSAKLTATSQVYETVLAGASGELSRDVNLEIDHAFRTWLIGALKVGYGTDNYVGLLSDIRYFASIGMTYKFNREVAMTAQVREDWQTSADPSIAYTATSFLLGLHLQR